MKKIIYPGQLDYLNKMRGKEDPLIIEMEEYAKDNNVPILDWLSASFLELLIKNSNTEKILELGTAIAYSSIRMARNLHKDAIVHTIEKSQDNIKTAEEFIKRSGSQKRIKILQGNAFDVMPTLKDKYDLIFLDADKQDYLKLLELSVPLLNKNGILFVDNLLWHGYTASVNVPAKYNSSTECIREFNKVFMSHPKLQSEIYSIGDGIGIGIKK